MNYYQHTYTKHKRRYSLLTLFVIVGLLLGACSSSSAPLVPTLQPATDAVASSAGEPVSSQAPVGGSTSSGSVVIGFGAQEYERPIYEPLIDAFNRENPGIQVQFISLDEIMNSGAPDQPYDMNSVNRRILSTTDTATTWGLVPETIQHGYVRDLKPLMDADPTFDRADFFTSGLSAGEVNSGSYMLPRMVRFRLVSYNKDLWTSRGVALPKPDWTWNDMLQAAEQLAQKRGNDVQTYGFMEGGATMMVFAGELATKGIDLFRSSSSQITLDQPEFVAALDRVKAMVDSGAIFHQGAPSEGPATENPFLALVESQQAAMWPHELLDLGPNAPKLPFTVGMVPYPQVNMPLFDNSADGYIMSSGTQHPNEAWRWLSFLSQQEIKYQAGGPASVGMVQARKSVTEKSELWSTLDADTVAAIKASLDRRSSPPPSGNDGRVFEPLSVAMQAVLTGKQNSAQALAEAQQTLDQIVAQTSASPSPSADTSPIIVERPVPDVAPAGATQITFGSFSSDPQLTRRLARAFNQTNQGVFVQVKDMPPAVEQVTIANVAGQVDCFSWGSAPEPKDLSATLDLKPLIDADASFNLNDYPPAVLASFMQGNALYGLPQSVNFRLLSYNQTAFAAANLERPRVDWSVQDFAQAAEQLTTGQGDNKQYGYIALGGQTSDLMFFIRRGGASVTNGSGDAVQPNFLDPKVQEAIQGYLELLRKASPHTKFTGYSRSGMGEDIYMLLSQGRAGMWLDSGFSFTPTGPDGQAATFTIATAPLPLNGKPFGPEDMTTRGLHISAQTKNAEACWTWIKYLADQVGSFDGSFPARKSLVASEAFISKAPAGAAEVYNEYSKVLDQAVAGDAQKPFYMSRIEFFWFFRAVDRAFGGEDLDRELAEAQEITEQYVACIQGGEKPATCAKQVDPKYDGFIIDEAIPLQGRG